MAAVRGAALRPERPVLPQHLDLMGLGLHVPVVAVVEVGGRVPGLQGQDVEVEVQRRRHGVGPCDVAVEAHDREEDPREAHAVELQVAGDLDVHLGAAAVPGPGVVGVE